MPRMIVSIDGVVIKDVQLSKQHTTLGRRPYNDIVIDNLAVSGEHAVLHMDEQEVEIEDLGSTNGTYVNAKAVRRQMLHTGDTIEVGRYKIRFVSEAAGENYEKTMVFKPSTLPAADSSLSRPAPMNSQPAPILATTAIIRVLSGAAAGREVTLHKVVTTVGKPGLAVASITRRHQGFVLAHVEGTDMPMLNGQAISDSPAHLKDGDRLELAGTVMQFEQR